MQGSSRTQFSQHETARNNLQSQILASQRYKEQLSYSFDAQATPIPQSINFKGKISQGCYFLQKRENLQQSFKIGLLTKSGIQYEDSKDKQTQKTHSTSQLNASQQVTQESNVQEMHYKMVKIQQKHKQMTEK